MKLNLNNGKKLIEELHDLQEQDRKEAKLLEICALVLEANSKGRNLNLQMSAYGFEVYDLEKSCVSIIKGKAPEMLESYISFKFKDYVRGMDLVIEELKNIVSEVV